ncbi:MAG: hypothetical protein OEO79_04845 [Gemmatimonadota bacterium]|nr:hypothetical protein [Gemmatimonadota bacterium]MDH3421350.1 hypothetical protein [Gemmatimonadota bacterium]
MKPIPAWSTALFVLALVAAVSPWPAAAQSESDWNSPSALQLVARARELRQSQAVDSALHSYQSRARGYVYFFFERPDTGERTLVKADQVALDVYWRAPGSTKQEIVGQRDRKVLPTDIRYHIDHLSVVQDDFGDYIRMGDGDEVEAVLHPVGPGSEAAYDFLLADSLTVSYASGAEVVRVYEVRVRPRDFDSPGFVGTIYLDRATAAIVRMRFSFTPASYIDPFVDHIRIALDNSLWMGRHWLPYRQEVEIRREIPALDLMIGSVIQGRFDVRGYEFNVELDDRLFQGRRVTATSPAQRAAFPFERGLFDDLNEQGIDTSPSLQAVEHEVREVVQDKALSGLDPLRLHFGGISDVARYNRAEGLRAGAGLTFRPTGGLTVRPSGGYALGRERFSGALTTSLRVGAAVPTLDLYWDRLRDVGGYPGASSLVNTISAVSGKQDFTDPFFSRGAALTVRGGRPGGLSAGVRWEEHHAARDVVSDDIANTEFRPVRSIEEGVLTAFTVRAPLDLPADGDLELSSELGHFEGRTFGSLAAQARWVLDDLDRPWQAEISLGGGGVTDQAPAQALYLLGGRWTLPGHDYRSFVGDRLWLLRTEVTVPIVAPYVGLRLLGGVGATYLDDRILPGDWPGLDSDGPRGSVGAGLALGWNSVRIDLAHGVRGGGWEALFSVSEQFRGWM